MNWGGRVPGSIPVGIFVLLGKEYFNPINAFMFIALIMEIYWISHEGKITLKFNPTYILWIFFSLWTFNIVFFDTFLWLGGSCNYLWMMVILLAFLIPYVQDYYNQNTSMLNGYSYSIGIFFLGILAGWSHETSTCWIILILTYGLYLCNKKGNLQTWKVSGLVGLYIGYAMLIFAPGNYSRYHLEQPQGLFFSADLIRLKLLVIAFILCVHFLLWYFLINFFVKYRKKFKKEVLQPYLNIAKACSFVAFSSLGLMFLLTAYAMRPSFLSLVFLTIGVASLFRIQEKTKISVFSEKARSMIKSFGYVYMAVTISFSLFNASVTNGQLNEILEKVYYEKKISTNNILRIEYSPIDRERFWFVASGFFHLIGLPITEDENHYNNKTFSKYYEIKGIKLIAN